MQQIGEFIQYITKANSCKRKINDHCSLLAYIWTDEQILVHRNNYSFSDWLSYSKNSQNLVFVRKMNIPGRTYRFSCQIR